jgi:mannose-6-phosphate isomerase-like protein (cupin superfamily)
MEENMGSQVKDVIEGDGYTVANLDGLGEGYGFRKIRQPLGVTAFGVNAVVLPAGIESGKHYHERQEELYFVHQGELEIVFGDGSSHKLGPGGLARVAPETVRQLRNTGDTDTVYVAIGAADGYVGRDGVVPEDETGERARPIAG